MMLATAPCTRWSRNRNAETKRIRRRAQRNTQVQDARMVLGRWAQAVVWLGCGTYRAATKSPTGVCDDMRSRSDDRRVWSKVTVNLRRRACLYLNGLLLSSAVLAQKRASVHKACRRCCVTCVTESSWVGGEAAGGVLSDVPREDPHDRAAPRPQHFDDIWRRRRPSWEQRSTLCAEV
jgi:hypothetical protein